MSRLLAFRLDSFLATTLANLHDGMAASKLACREISGILLTVIFKTSFSKDEFSRVQKSCSVRRILLGATEISF
jgi:hypothetical protein